jgi:hypothetical protein
MLNSGFVIRRARTCTSGAGSKWRPEGGSQSGGRVYNRPYSYYSPYFSAYISTHNVSTSNKEQGNLRMVSDSQAHLKLPLMVYL